MSSLLIATSRYTYKHPLYSRNRAMVEFLQRKNCLDFSKITVLYPDQFQGERSPEVKTLSGCLEELRFSLRPLRGDHPAIEPSYAVSKVIPFFREKKLHYDFCVAADLTGWQIAYPLRKLNYVSSLIYDDQDYFPRVIKSPQGHLTSVGLENMIAKTSDAVVSASDSLAKLRRRQGARRVFVIPNGVDPGYLTHEKIDYSERLTAKTIFYAGYLSHEYGVGLLVKAFSRLNSNLGAKLLLAGIGPLETELKQITQAEPKNSRLHLFGKVEHSKLASLMSGVTLGAAPFLEGSGAEYGIPLKIKEYMAVGLPVVTTNIGEISNFISGKEVGAAVEPTPDALEGALSSILNLSLSEYSEMGERARRSASKYSWDTLYAEYFRTLREIFN